jgi:chemotaxis protein CheX
MAGTEVAVRAVYQAAPHHPPGDVVALVAISSPTVVALSFSYPAATAAALAKRILAESAKDVDESLVRDCMGELANVVAGQAKALLAGTPYQFVFSLPVVVPGAQQPPFPEGQDCLVIAFDSAQGEFALRLLVLS